MEVEVLRNFLKMSIKELIKDPKKALQNIKNKQVSEEEVKDFLESHLVLLGGNLNDRKI